MHAEVTIAREVYVQKAFCTVNPLWCSYVLLNRWDHEGLSSPYWRWYWNDRPGASIEYSTSRLNLDPGHVVLIPPNTVFATHTDRQVGHLHCHFWLSTRLVSDTAGPIRLTTSRADRERLRSAIRLMDRQEEQQREPRISLNILSLVADALARAEYDWDVQNHDPLVDHVRQRIHAAPAQKQLDNKTLAEEVGVSVNTLLRRFHRATGTSPRQFSLQLRVERGADLLRSGDMSIPEIAELCGFIDRYHFTRAFTARSGTSPSAFRKRYRMNEFT